MRESRLYLNFLKDNLIIYLIAIIIFSLLGFYYQARQPIIYQRTRLIQMNYDQTNVAQRIALADQAVSDIRSENIQTQLGLDHQIKLNAFKPGPLSVNLTISGVNQLIILANLEKAASYVKAHYPVSVVGNDVESFLQPNRILGASVGFGLGFLISTLISLTREYFNRF